MMVRCYMKGSGGGWTLARSALMAGAPRTPGTVYTTRGTVARNTAARATLAPEPARSRCARPERINAIVCQQSMRYPEGTQVAEELELSGQKHWLVAKKAGIDPHRLSDIINGKKRAYWDEILRIAEALERPVANMVHVGERFEDRRAGQRPKRPVRARKAA